MTPLKQKRAQPAGKDEPRLTLELIQAKLHQRVKEVKKAAKKAKEFEIQRFLKKQRLAKIANTSSPNKSMSGGPSDGSELLRLLKKVNHEHLACAALYKKAEKDEILSTDQLFLSALGREVPSSLRWRETPLIGKEAEIENKILSSKHLSLEVRQAIESLQRLIAPQDLNTSNQPGNQDLTTVIASLPGDEMSDASPLTDSTVDDDEIFLGVEPDYEIVQDDGWESGSVDESGQVMSHKSTLDGRDANHGSISKNLSQAANLEQGRVPPSPKVAETGSKPMASTSAFLPSLAIGYTRGDSDASDISGEEDAKEMTKKANRRGQRARKMIWEKKYGLNANHVKRERRERDLINSNPGASKGTYGQGWKTMRGNKQGAGWGKARASSDRGHKPQSMAFGGNLGGQSRGGRGDNSAKVGEYAGASALPLPRSLPSASTVRPTHGSWEAKRKLREKESQTKPQGKKTIFE